MKKSCLDLSSLLTIILGNVLYALAVQLFLVPADLMTGGATGISLAFGNYFNVPVSLVAFIINFTMLIIGYFLISKEFALSTLVSTFVFPFALSIFEHIFPNVVLSENLLLNTIYGGMLMGISLGLVIKTGASTGGMDIPALILNKYFKIPLSFLFYGIDVVILVLQLGNHSYEQLLYGALNVLLYSVILDQVLISGNVKTEIKIISDKYDLIRETILTKVDRGVTLINSKTGYLGNDTEMVLSIISNRELPVIEKLVYSIDPNCFMIVSRVNQVTGRGFSTNKEYKQKN